MSQVQEYVFNFNTRTGIFTTPSNALAPVDGINDGPSTAYFPNGYPPDGWGHASMTVVPPVTGSSQPSQYGDGLRIAYLPLVPAMTAVEAVKVIWDVTMTVGYYVENRSATDSGNYSVGAGTFGIGMCFPQSGAGDFTTTGTLPALGATALATYDGVQDYIGPSGRLVRTKMTKQKTIVSAVASGYPYLDSIQEFRYGIWQTGALVHIFPCVGITLGTESWSGTTINNLTRFQAGVASGTAKLLITYA